MVFKTLENLQLSGEIFLVDWEMSNAKGDLTVVPTHRFRQMQRHSLGRTSVRLHSKLGWMILLLAIMATTAKAGLNLNFRSRQLSKISSTKQKPQSSKSTSKQKDALSPDILRLDLSGRLQILLAGDREPETTIPARGVEQPLWSWDDTWYNPWRPRRVHLAIDYDFARTALGVLRLGPLVTWHVANGAKGSTNLRPQQVELAVEKGVSQGIPNALQTNLWWNPWHGKGASGSSSSPRLQVQCQQEGLASLSCSLPLHARVSCQATVSRNLWGDRTRLTVPTATTTHPDWWLPDLSISPSGALDAQKQMWIPGPQQDARMRRHPAMWGFRLAVRRQLEWSLWSTSPTEDSAVPTTSLRLQVQAAASTWRADVGVETSLEAPVQDARATISTHVHSSPATKDS